MVPMEVEKFFFLSEAHNDAHVQSWPRTLKKMKKNKKRKRTDKQNMKGKQHKNYDNISEILDYRLIKII